MAHNVTISKVVNGVIVSVGCKTFVSEDIEGAMKEIARYLMSPKTVESEYNTRYNLRLTPSVNLEAGTALPSSEVRPAPTPITYGGDTIATRY